MGLSVFHRDFAESRVDLLHSEHVLESPEVDGFPSLGRHRNHREKGVVPAEQFARLHPEEDEEECEAEDRDYGANVRGEGASAINC